MFLFNLEIYFFISELLALNLAEPIKSNKKGISRYISKYISKHIKERKPEDKGARLCQYSLFDVFKICSTRFAFWSDGYKEFIRKLQLFIKVVLSYFSSNYKSSPPSDSEEDIDNFIKKYMGNKWIFNNAQIIYFIDEVLSIYGERTIHYFIKKQIIKKQMKEIKSYLPSFFVNSDDMKGIDYVSYAR